MVVKFSQDTKELAEKYDVVSDSQFQNGCFLVKKLGIKPGDTVLDIGCGTGQLGRYVAGIIGGEGRYLGIDPLDERITIALQNNEYDNAAFQQGSAEKLGFVQSASYDAVYLNWVFHWISAKEPVLQEISRILKPGGKIGMTLPSLDLRDSMMLNNIPDAVLSGERYRQVVRLEASPQKQYNMTTTELIQLLKKAGFAVKDIHIEWSARLFPTAQAIIDFTEASFFGNFLNHVPEHLREQAKADIKAEFEKYATPEGLLLGYYPLYAVAQKGESL